MDPRSQKPRDFVAMSRNMTEDVRKSRLRQIKWFQKYESLMNEYKKLQYDLNQLQLYKGKTAKVKDDIIIERAKTCLPIPITSSGEYGWLATKSKFRLEKYGSFIVHYPNPLKEITLLTGAIPTLACGKGLV